MLGSQHYRREFLKLFGVTAAALPTISLAGTEIEILRESRSEVGPILESGYAPSVFTKRSWQDIRKQAYDIQSAQLYSANVFGGDFGNRQGSGCFSYAWGQAVEWKPEGTTIADTNMCIPRMLPPPEVFLVQRMGLVLSPLSEPRARSEFIDSAVMTLWIGQKYYQRFLVASIFTVGDELLQEYPRLPLHSTGALPLPLIIESRSEFYIHIEGARNNTPVKIWAVLDGLHARGVS